MIDKAIEISDAEIRVLGTDSKVQKDVCASLSDLLSQVNVNKAENFSDMLCIDEDGTMSGDFSSLYEQNISEERVGEILLECRKEKGEDFRKSLIDLLKSYSGNNDNTNTNNVDLDDL